MTINERLSEIQKKLNVPKSQYNSFGKYKYRSCEDILEAVKPLLNNLTLSITDDLVNVGHRFYIKATAILSDGENSIQTSALAREPEEKKGMDQSQITGTASSYARKYALNGLFCIDDTKDADATNDHKEQPKSQPINKEQLKTILELLPKTDKTAEDICHSMKIESISALPATKFDWTVNRLNQLIAEKNADN